MILLPSLIMAASNLHMGHMSLSSSTGLHCRLHIDLKLRTTIFLGQNSNGKMTLTGTEGV
jgi:hypothetical protein